MSEPTQLATFGAGCFWGVEARFRALPGVVVQVRYDAGQVSYEALLALFFEMHNPTTLNRQGPDIGSQYRSVIFFHSESQQQVAATAIAALDASDRWNQPVVTQLVAAPEFWPAEEYHQRYLEKNGYGFCSI